MIISPILTTSLEHSSCKGRENVLFELGNEIRRWHANFGSTQVFGDARTLPWVRSRVWVGAGLGLAVRVG